MGSYLDMRNVLLAYPLPAQLHSLKPVDFPENG